MKCEAGQKRFNYRNQGDDLMDFYFMSLLLNIVLLIIIMAMLLVYRKQESSYRKQLLDKMDRLIQLMDAKKTSD